MNDSKRLNPTLISLIVIVLIAVAAAGVYAATHTATDDSKATAQQENSPQTSSGVSQANDASYKDGTYTETGRYVTPGGGETIAVTVTLSNGTVTDVSAKGSASRGDSSEYQSEFLSNYKQYVVGKPISSLSLSRVAGSSLTSNGFNQAIEQIKTDASS